MTRSQLLSSLSLLYYLLNIVEAIRLKDPYKDLKDPLKALRNPSNAGQILAPLLG